MIRCDGWMGVDGVGRVGGWMEWMEWMELSYCKGKVKYGVSNASQKEMIGQSDYQIESFTFLELIDY